MSAIAGVAERFFDACETGKGWVGCERYCRPGATFSAQSDALQGIDTRHMTKIWNDTITMQQLGWA